MQVNVYDAKTHLSKLIDRAEKGEEIVIARAGKPCVRLVPVAAPSARRFGIDQGVYSVPSDFDAPLAPEVLDSFEA